MLSSKNLCFLSQLPRFSYHVGYQSANSAYNCSNPPIVATKPLGETYNIDNMKLLLRISYLLPLIFFTSAIFSGCKEDEEEKIGIKFESNQTEVDEGDTVVINLILDKPATKKEYLTISVDSPAGFGVDFGIGGVLTLDEDFSIEVEKGSTVTSFSFIALLDFENNEAVEEVKFEIGEATPGLVPQAPSSHSIKIASIPNYTVDNRTLVFDGVDDYIDLGNIYDNLALPVTISAWIWLDPTVKDGLIPIFDSQDGVDVYNGFNFITSNYSIAGAQYGDGFGSNNSYYRRAKSAQFSTIMGRWVNLTAVIKGAVDMDLYFNGVDVGGTYSGESNSPMNSNSPNEVAKIGYMYQNGTEFRFKGKIDELKIWNRSLSLQEVQKVIFKKLDETEPGLIGYWNFDEPTGTALLDHSKSHFDGVIKGNPQRVLSEVPVR